MSKDLYGILGVDRTADEKEIKASFRHRAISLHPDKNPGDAEKAELFKEASNAYSILSDPEKRRNYDLYGITDENGANNMPDMGDILSGIFGGDSGFGGMPGFSFSVGGGGMPEDLLNHLFGGAGRPRKNRTDVIDVPVDICSIYYGDSKKIEFEIMDKCGKCDGTGAEDPSYLVKCSTCKGHGHVTMQANPFMVQRSTCPSCYGKGKMIKNNRLCKSCDGNKTTYAKKLFELKIPRGIPDGHEVKMEKKGSYDEETGKYNDMVFRFKYVIESPYSLDNNMNVHYEIAITIEELLTGFVKRIKLYNDDFVIKSDRYFNPSAEKIKKGFGIFDMRKNKSADLYFKFFVEFTDSKRLSKYNEVLQKVIQFTPEIIDDSQNVIDVSFL